jgi:hypothetical protein
MVENQNQNNIVLTGLPRSGTTLTCHLLNGQPNVVALHEPMDVNKLGRLKSAADRVRMVSKFFDDQRRSLLTKSVATSKVINGKVPDNPIGAEKTRDGYRRSAVTGRKMQLDKPLTSDFLLAIKHPSAFTAMLVELTGEFSCYAVIRNPLSVLSSWNSVEFPVATGHAPAAEQIDRGLARMLAGIRDVHQRQIALLSWFFGQYREHIGADRVLRYEEIVASNGRAVEKISGSRGVVSGGMKLESKNNNKLYNRDTVMHLADLMLESDGAFWDFYTREDVASVAENYSKS